MAVVGAGAGAGLEAAVAAPAGTVTVGTETGSVGTVILGSEIPAPLRDAPAQRPASPKARRTSGRRRRTSPGKPFSGRFGFGSAPLVEEEARAGGCARLLPGARNRARRGRRGDQAGVPLLGPPTPPGCLGRPGRRGEVQDDRRRVRRALEACEPAALRPVRLPGARRLGGVARGGTGVQRPVRILGPLATPAAPERRPRRARARVLRGCSRRQENRELSQPRALRVVRRLGSLRRMVPLSRAPRAAAAAISARPTTPVASASSSS